MVFYAHVTIHVQVSIHADKLIIPCGHTLFSSNLLKLSARRKHVRTANCGQRANQNSHVILYQLNYHHNEVIAAGRCGLDICITFQMLVPAGAILSVQM